MPHYKLPDVGEGLTEAEIVQWKVAIGDVVKVNDVLVDIETAKSVVELPSPFAGEVTELLVGEGDTVTVGTPIVGIGTATSSTEPEDSPDAGAEQKKAPERQAMLVGYGPSSEVPTRRRRRSSTPAVPAADVAPEPAPEAPLAAEPQQDRKVLARPPVRMLAKNLGVDLAAVPCAGEIVTRAEVEAFAREGVPAPQTSVPAAVPDASGDVRVPIKGVRKMTAQAMVASAFTAPHVTEWVTIDVSETVRLVERLRADRAFADLKVSPTVVIAKAVCLAMRRTPELNSAWDEAAQEIVLKGSINLGIAAATARGLVVPNIRSAESLSMPQLAAALTDLTDTARAGRTQPEQMSGGTFTITNVGVFGVDGGTPILNPGEAGILCVGAISRRPWVAEDDTIVPRWVTTLALSFDHRLVDGQQGSAFLADVARILSDPAAALSF
ncbi:dihydrolipoamide acetyltransferase family protein [Aeromicrobium sp. CF3.5]|uniref:dihydrolipoamide acetyltransferase family protein n=1 Tax=Aeromicrobium sp. CF3.5 TaxID=3373078 RepID=UPI003EE72991